MQTWSGYGAKSVFLSRKEYHERLSTIGHAHPRNDTGDSFAGHVSTLSSIDTKIDTQFATRYPVDPTLEKPIGVGYSSACVDNPREVAARTDTKESEQ
jgi:hypothetical protein